MADYYRLADIVAGFDQRLLTVKSWGVTFSLATLALGFQQDHYGLFLVAAAGALSFWVIEGSTKSHQMRYYPRMGDIEVIAYELYAEETADGKVSSPLIDRGWHTAAQRTWGERPPRIGWKDKQSKRGPDDTKNSQCRSAGKTSTPTLASTTRSCCAARALPHIISVVLGLGLFVLGLAGVFGPI